jgi:hypothetical protein
MDSTKEMNIEKNINSPSNDEKSTKLNVNKKSIYNHIIGKRFTKSTSNTNVNIKKENSLPAVSLVLDRFNSFFIGESSEERKTRINIIRYKDMLTYELELFKYNKDLHRGHGTNLINEFQIQENQLLKWSQCELIMKSFKLQSWLRVSRSKLLEEITLTSINLIDYRIKKTEKIINQFISSINNKNENVKKHEISEYNKYCSQTIEKVLDKDHNIKNYYRQLIKIDKFCSIYLISFQLNIPLIDSISESERTNQLNDILVNYKKYMILSDKSTVNSNISYNEFLKFYSERNNEMKLLEARFSNFAEDEREREGRLIRRFCSLISNDDNSNIRKGRNVLYYSKVANFYPDIFPNDSIEEASKRISMLNENDLLLSPTSIMAFIKYFAINIMSKRYSISMEYLDVLLALSEALLFKRMASRIFIYNDQLKEKDRIWRSQCEIASKVSPLEYGLPLEYFENNNDTSDIINNSEVNSKININEMDTIIDNNNINNDNNEIIDTITNIKNDIIDNIEKGLMQDNDNNVKNNIKDNLSEKENINIIKGIMESYDNNLNIISFLQIKNDSKFGKHYSNSSRIMSQMATSTSPRVSI